MQSTATFRVAQARFPLLGQHDLRNIRVAAVRILNLHGAAPYLPRNLSRAELQLLHLCEGICEIVKGELGEDGEGDTVGDLKLQESPILPAAHQPRLEGNGQ